MRRTTRTLAGESWVEFFLLKQRNIIALALFPLLYVVINPSFGQNQGGDIDTWFYFGLAKYFWHQWGPDFHNDYYETRLPYIIPAAVVFAIPNDRIGYLISSYLIYCSCSFSLFYVLSRQVSKPTALLATIFMATDIFFMRTVGWQYVDGGVLAYGSLAFAALTAAATSRYKQAFVALSGFFYTSMLITHLGSAPLGLALFGYAILILDMRRMLWKEFCILLLCAGLGALGSQIIYGFLNMHLYGTKFLFEGQQIEAGKLTQMNVALWEESGFYLPLARGWWLTVHIGVWFAAAVMIFAKFAKLYKPTTFQSYCMWIVFSIYALLFTLDYFHISVFLGRSGLYVSTYLFLSYLFVGSILPGQIKTSTVLICGGLFLASLTLRLKFGSELATGFGATPAWACGLALGSVIAAVGLLRRGAVQVMAAPVAAVLSLPILWDFTDQSEVYAARDAVAKAVGNELPYFAFSEKDPAYVPVIIGLVGSFTPRAWWIRCAAFPDCSIPTFGHDMMIVVSSNSDTADVSRMTSAAMPELTLTDAKLIYRSDDKFSVYRFNIRQWPVLIPASKLYSYVGSVQGSARVAMQGTNPGYLAFGPHSAVSPGRYEVTIKYKSEGETGSWDITTEESVIIAKGSIPDTHGATGDIVAAIDLPHGAWGFEARTLYSGHGRLSIESLGIRLLGVSLSGSADLLKGRTSQFDRP